jgi:lipopolysaccharide export system protein LptA
MSPRRCSLGILLAALAAACGRGAPRPSTTPDRVPQQTPPVVAAPDTARATPDTTKPPVIALPPAPPAATDSARRAAKPAAPARRCLLDLLNTPETRLLIITDPISGKRTTYFGAGVIAVCRGQDMRMTADSAESYEQNGLHYLIGNVKYREERASLDADRLTYFQSDERLLAEGNVLVVMKDSSSMVGPRAEYFRAVRPLREASRIVSTGRPTLRMYETDSTGKRQTDPVQLVANTIIGEGETLYVAQGQVQLDRTDLKATGDSAVLDNVRQFSRLMLKPVVESKGDQPFTLRGRVIDVFGRTRRLDRILAVDSASAVSKDLTLTADTVDLRVANNKLQRAFAFGPGQRLATAVTKERTILAESLHVDMPDQRIRELHAVGSAFAESDPDTSKVTTKERDWLRGDTIVARFDSVAKGDTARQPAIRELVASGSASSFYQISSNSGQKDKPGLNYVRGALIRIDFSEREVQTVTVENQAAGIYLEAAKDSTASTRPGAQRPPARRRPPSR